jgi:cytochrome c553
MVARSRFISAALFSLMVITPVMPASADEAAALELFEKHVRPTLLDQCIRCHGAEKQRGGLRLDSRSALLKGGDTGPAVTPGDPDASLLIKAIRYDDVELEMPPRGRLPEAVVAAIEKWVKLGAHDPRGPPESIAPAGPSSPNVEEGRSFWSFQPIERPAPPNVNDPSWPLTDIDRFVLARLENNGLRPVKDADRESLIRRVYYDVIGLPPTPEQVRAFVADRSDDAYAKVVDELLHSPHFGERWGRHWLDVVRFAESSGGGRTLLFPDAWRYRDYVIDSLNDDLPYDEFIKQQIAGDLLEHADRQDHSRNLIATGFLLLGPTNYELQDKEILEMDIIDEQLDTLGKAFMGMTIGCARCHDHKFDPIPARDYYAMAGILKSTKAVIHSNVSTWNKVDLPLPPEQEAVSKDHEQRIAQAKQQLASVTKAWKKAGGAKQLGPQSIDPATLPGIVIDDSAAEKVGDWLESTSIAGFVGQHYVHDQTAGKGDKRVIYRAELPAGGKYEVRISHTASTNRSTRVPVHVHHAGGESVVTVNQRKPAPIDRVFTSLGIYEFAPGGDPRIVVSNSGTDDGVVIADAVVFIAQAPSKSTNKPAAKPPQTIDKQQLATLKEAVDAAKAKLEQLEKSRPQRPVAMATADEAQTGDIHLAIRGVVHNQGPLIPRGVLQVASTDPLPPIPSDCSGRIELASWIASPQHPLTSRVMANRVWYWLTGRGLVPTVDNFGRTGRPPTHPLLLDHLATSLVDQGWSIKKLVRQILLSRVYRLSTNVDGANQQLDPDNRLLWRMNRKRLRAEDIRDTLLFVAGSLDLKHGGPTIKPGTSIEYGYRFDTNRRSVYLPVFRNTLPELFEVFDFADPNIQQGQRTTSTIASQALLLMNHPFVIEQAKAAAAAMPEDAQFDTLAGVQHAYYQVLGRPPSSAERTIAVEFIEGAAEASKRVDRWALLYQTLFECVDFRYLN